MTSAMEKADQKLHPVETQWCYRTLTPYGFVCEDPPQQGLVRSYDFKHPDGTWIRYTIGARMDHWTVKEGIRKGGGLWKDLVLYLQGGYDETSSI